MNKTNPELHLIKINFIKGHSSAFKALFNKYHKKLFFFVNGYTNDSALSEDIVQDAFVKLWESRSKIDPEKSISGYLFKIAYNIFIDSYRSHQKEAAMLDTLAYKKSLEVNSELESYNEDKVEELMNFINELPPKCKEVFKMSKFEGLKYKEIAIAMNISVKTVEVHMCRAYKILRDKINKNSLLLFLTNLFTKNNLRKVKVFS